MRRPHQRGFTAIEMMVVVALIGVILALGMPSFLSMFDRKRMENVANELSLDLQYARSEAVARNANVTVTHFGTDCYVVHLSSAPPVSCPETQPFPAGTLKVVRLPTGSKETIAAPACGASAPAATEFDWVRGVPPPAPSGSSVSFSGDRQAFVCSTAGPWQLRTTISGSGRVELCSPGGSFKGYRAC